MKKQKNKTHQAKKLVVPPENTAEPARATVSVCIIAKNEKDNLRRCLSSIADFADEIIIADAGSTVAAKEIAGEYGAKVYVFPSAADDCAARNEIIKYATKEFIMWLDATDEFREEEQKILSADLASIKECILLRKECGKMNKILKQEMPEGMNQDVKYIIRLGVSDIQTNNYVEQFRVFENYGGFYFINKAQEQIASKANVRPVSSMAKIHTSAIQQKCFEVFCTEL